MDPDDGDKQGKDGPIDLAFSAMTWVVAIIAVLVVVGLALFFWLGLGPSGGEDSLGLLSRIGV